MNSKPAPAGKSEPQNDDPEFVAAVDDGIADADAGRVVSYEKVRRWLLSWGSDSELLPPKVPGGR